ncbi:MAG TPA: excinuclease ABC subunit A [Alphaproteobacteria bacterium]|nr:excinuclease ABC subunit A [Alphaproteobacteria bacterium]
MAKYIEVKGAREHNLKNIDVKIPKNSLTVITGLSGSGKSSLAFDTIYAEGHRRFVESLSAYARQFLNITAKPEVDSITGLSPAIAIEQKTTSKNPRSTVGTITEIYDYLRILYTQVGTPYCPTHKIAISSQTVSEMVDKVLTMPEKTRIQILAPIVRQRKGEHSKLVKELQKQGFTKIKVDGEMFQIEDFPELDKKFKHDLEIVVDRLAVKPDNQSRLAESIETALGIAEDLVIVETVPKDDTKPEQMLFSAKYACPHCGFSLPDLEPRMFSFNSPFGACQTCDGIGGLQHFDEHLIIEDYNKALLDEVKGKHVTTIRPWSDLNELQYDILISLAKKHKINLLAPANTHPDEFMHELFYGSKEPLTLMEGYKGEQLKFKGIIPSLEKQWKVAGPHKKYALNRFRSLKTCTDCNGSRLKDSVLAVKINDLSISDVTQFSITQSKEFFGGLYRTLSEKNKIIAKPILKEINERLSFLSYVGLDYLSLDRTSGTLSGGESQRIRLASQVGSGLNGVLYVLDEPSIGLHQKDNDRLLDTLKQLRDLDNTVIVVEHDEDAIRSADYVLDIGPKAGIHGGQVIAAGTPKQIMANKKSVTGAYLNGERKIAIPENRRPVSFDNKLSVLGASANNLKNVDVDFPLGVMTCVTGVSGGGKSSLVIDTLYQGLAQRLNGGHYAVGKHKDITGLEHIDKIVDIDQSPIGRTPRSNPATYTGLMDPIRTWFSGLPASKARGYKPGRFSFNVKGGRCEACQGDGLIKIEMHFLADVYVPCEVCDGKRYNRETLDVKQDGKTIADVLDMSVEEALEFFSEVPNIRKTLQLLMDVGLSYIKLGQSATTLSGGEAQRIKLAKELSKRSTGKTLYILDEPTTGLHFQDIDLLLKVLHRLVDEGNTMVIIEHNLDVIKTADYIIDIGPEGGQFGGEIVAKGVPEKVATSKKSHTARYLKQALEK